MRWSLLATARFFLIIVSVLLINFTLLFHTVIFAFVTIKTAQFRFLPLSSNKTFSHKDYISEC